MQNVTLPQFTSAFFFLLEKGPRGEKGSSGEVVMETVKTEVSSLASQSEWYYISTLLLDGCHASRPAHS